jgi:anti-anti-sigma factor
MAEPSADLTVSESGDGADRTVRVVVEGELDAIAGANLRTLLSEAIDESPSAVVLELAGLTFIDSVGISVIVAGYKRSEAAGVAFELHDLPAPCRRVFEITRLTDVLTIRP